MSKAACKPHKVWREGKAEEQEVALINSVSKGVQKTGIQLKTLCLRINFFFLNLTISMTTDYKYESTTWESSCYAIHEENLMWCITVLTAKRNESRPESHIPFWGCIIPWFYSMKIIVFWTNWSNTEVPWVLKTMLSQFALSSSKWASSEYATWKVRAKKSSWGGILVLLAQNHGSAGH